MSAKPRFAAPRWGRCTVAAGREPEPLRGMRCGGAAHSGGIWIDDVGDSGGPTIQTKGKWTPTAVEAIAFISTDQWSNGRLKHKTCHAWW